MSTLLAVCLMLIAGINTTDTPFTSADLIPAPSRSIDFVSQVGAVEYPDPGGGSPRAFRFAYKYCMNTDPADQEVAIGWKLTRNGQDISDSDGPIHSPPPACSTVAPINPDLQGDAGGYAEGDIITITATFTSAAGNPVTTTTTYTITAADMARLNA